MRHNEDGLNKDLSILLPLPVEPPESFDSPHTKTNLLLQAHFSRAELPIADYSTDTKSVLDQALRILQVLCFMVTSKCIGLIFFIAVHD